MFFVTSHASKKWSIAGTFVTDPTFKYDQLATLPNTKKSTYIQICVFSFKSDHNVSFSSSVCSSYASKKERNFCTQNIHHTFLIWIYSTDELISFRNTHIICVTYLTIFFKYAKVKTHYCNLIIVTMVLQFWVYTNYSKLLTTPYVNTSSLLNLYTLKDFAWIQK